MPSFSDALDAHPAPARLGDVSLRYEPSMLIGETPKPRATLWPTAIWLGGLCALGGTVALLLLHGPLAPAALLCGVGVLGVGGSAWLSRIERRQRRFVANFATNALRLDFVTPFAGQPRTLVVPFDAVRAVALETQADGQRCLTVDFLPPSGPAVQLREVLAACIGADEDAHAERLSRVLSAAFGLGEVPADSPWRQAREEDAGPHDAFE